MTGSSQTKIQIPSGSVGSDLKRCLGAMILIAACMSIPAPAPAVEGGGSNWIMGVTGFGAGVVPEPGFHLGNLTWITEFSTNQNITSGTNVITALDVDIYLNAHLPTYTGDIEAWDARYQFLAFIPLIWIDGTFRAGNDPQESEHKDAQLGDMGFEVALGWKEEDFLGVDGLNLDYAPGFLIVAPTGHYERQEVLNAGRHRWSFQPHVGYTLFHEGTGIEASQRIMYSFNTKNGRTNYRSGQEFHFDWALGKRFESGLQAGLFGVWYRQTTADGGQGAQATGNLKGKAWGIGPVVQYSGELFGVPFSTAIRYQKVPQHRNRVDDDGFFFQAAFSF